MLQSRRMVADPKILYWVSGIVVSLLVVWVVFVNARVETRGPGAKEPRDQGEKQKEKKKAPAPTPAKVEEKEKDDEE